MPRQEPRHACRRAATPMGLAHVSMTLPAPPRNEEALTHAHSHIRTHSHAYTHPRTQQKPTYTSASIFHSAPTKTSVHSYASDRTCDRTHHAIRAAGEDTYIRRVHACHRPFVSHHRPRQPRRLARFSRPIKCKQLATLSADNRASTLRTRCASLRALRDIPDVCAQQRTGGEKERVTTSSGIAHGY